MWVGEGTGSKGDTRVVEGAISANLASPKVSCRLVWYSCACRKHQRSWASHKAFPPRGYRPPQTCSHSQPPELPPVCPVRSAPSLPLLQCAASHTHPVSLSMIASLNCDLQKAIANLKKLKVAPVAERGKRTKLLIHGSSEFVARLRLFSSKVHPGGLGPFESLLPSSGNRRVQGVSGVVDIVYLGVLFIGNIYDKP